jgi:hypothetical protein
MSEQMFIVARNIQADIIAACILNDFETFTNVQGEDVWIWLWSVDCCEKPGNILINN